LDFAPGQAEADLNIKVYGDENVDTQLLYFQLNLADPSEGTLDPGLGTASVTVLEPYQAPARGRYSMDYSGSAAFAFSTCTYYLDDSGSVEITILRTGSTDGEADAQYT